MKLLIIDGDTVRQRHLRTILASVGYKSAEVESAFDAQAGLNAIKKKKFDCIFLSMVLTNKNSLDVIKELRDSSRTKTLPVIMYGSSGSRDEVIAAAQAGASSILSYPFSVSDVETGMKQALAKSQAAG